MSPDAQAQANRCKQEGCSVERDGKCLEGLEPLKCPHYLSAQAESANEGTEQTDVTKTAEENSVIPLPSGEDLDPRSAAEISRAALARVIIIAGEAESGKTTLLASIYERFNEGPFAGYLFAGSKTLRGWERRCHMARVACGGSKPDTERTLGLKPTLLHLEVRVFDLARTAQSILFTDISGELFERIRDSSQECRRLSLLKRADRFVLTLDGERLSRSEDRQEAFHNGAMILRSCCDEGMLGAHSFVDVLFTKYDLFGSKEQENAETKAFFAYVERTIKERFAHRLGRLRFFRVAARSDTKGVECAFGVPSILPSWIEETPLDAEAIAYTFPTTGLKREFDLYLRKRLPTLVTGE